MREYIIRRILLMIPTIVVVAMVVFLLCRFIPGDIVDLMALQMVQASPGGPTSVVTPDWIRHALGLDVSIPVQFGRWIAGIFTRGDFGSSLWTGKPVIDEILRRLPVSVELGLLGFIVAVLIGLPVGIISAIRQDTWLDYLTRSFSILGISIPSFWLATLVVVLPAVWWHWAPSVRFIPFSVDPVENLKQFLLPAAILGFGMAGVTVRYLRTTLLETMRQDYIRTAWSKGLQERVVVIRHALKNAFIPVITVLFGQAWVMIGGVVIIEQIFTLPGMGRLFIDAVFRRDYPYITGINTILSVIGMLFILANDLSYAYFDPRIRYK
jgi:peptide/nickel transport system permease protein